MSLLAISKFLRGEGSICWWLDWIGLMDWIGIDEEEKDNGMVMLKWDRLDRKKNYNYHDIDWYW